VSSPKFVDQNAIFRDSYNLFLISVVGEKIPHPFLIIE